MSPWMATRAWCGLSFPHLKWVSFLLGIGGLPVEKAFDLRPARSCFPHRNLPKFVWQGPGKKHCIPSLNQCCNNDHLWHQQTDQKPPNFSTSLSTLAFVGGDTKVKRAPEAQRKCDNTGWYDRPGPASIRLRLPVCDQHGRPIAKCTGKGIHHLGCIFMIFLGDRSGISRDLCSFLSRWTLIFYMALDFLRGERKVRLKGPSPTCKTSPVRRRGVLGHSRRVDGGQWCRDDAQRHQSAWSNVSPNTNRILVNPVPSR